MDERYKVELRDRDPATVEDLILDNCQVSDGKINGLSDALVNLESLSMINCGLKSFEGLPKLPNLKRLDVSDNSISGGLDIVAKQCPELGALVLTNCKYADVDAFAPLKEINVETLDAFSNEVAKKDNYREEVFSLLPNLKYLDGVNQEGEELDESDDGEDGEEFGMHGESDSDCDSGEEDGPGLSYLDNSQLDDEDESEDYDPDAKKAQKRKHEGDGDAEPDAKK